MIYAIAGSFASVFMLAKGYDNVHIGMTLAAANLLALALQPYVADHMDRAKGIRLIDAAAWMTLIMMIAAVGLFIFGDGSFMLAAILAFVLAVHALAQPLLNSLGFRLSESGANVSFGIGRAGGSLGYSAILAVLGTIVERKGVMTLPALTEAACALLIVLLLITKGSFIRICRTADAKAAEGAEAEAKAADDERIDLGDFIRRNKHFFIMNFGVAGLLFSNAVLSNYMAQIAGGVNGTTEDVGRILSLMALLEIPTMVFFGSIRKRFSSRALIKLAALGFTGKIALCWLAGSVRLLYVAQFFQLIAFALIMPAMVYFINEIMSPGEAVKGQALYTMMFTFSTIIASFLGGWMLDAYGARMLTLVSTLVTAAGAAVVIFSIDKVEDHKRLPQD